MKTMITRLMKHKDDINESRKRGLDRCHEVMLRWGFCRFLFFGFADMDRKQPEVRHMRLQEFKTFVLLEPTLNTLDQQGTYKDVKPLF